MSAQIHFHAEAGRLSLQAGTCTQLQWLPAAAGLGFVAGGWWAMPIQHGRALCQRELVSCAVLRRNFMKTLLALAVGSVALLITVVALAQNGNMMTGGSGMGYGGWMGGYGAFWLPILLVIVALGLVAWFIKQKGK
jgi:hypothetical protein